MVGPGWLTVCLLLCVLGGCQGAISSPSGGPTEGGQGTPAASLPNDAMGRASALPNPATARRLTRFEYDNTVRDLLGIEAKAASEFPSEEMALGFDDNASALMFSPTLAEQAFGKAMQLAPAAVEKAGSFAPCTTADVTAECARSFAAGFGKRAYRRPLAEDELDRILQVMQPSVVAGDFEHALELGAAVILSSFPFFYRVELGTGVAPANKPGFTELTSYEVAARLSYTLWGSLPDDSLLALADRGELQDVATIEQQAGRLLSDARARRVIARFHEQWLELKLIASANHDPALFPDYTPEVPALLRQELDAFLDHAAFDGKGLRDVFAGSYSYWNGPLAAFYGAAAMSGTELRRVELEPGKYAGLLTRAGPLSSHAGFSFTSPTRRGAFVRRRLLCQELPPPPANVSTTPAADVPGKTRRDLVAQHSRDPSCASCHALTDPIGLGLEDFDATGRFRTLENANAVDAAGEVVDSSIGAFRGGAELGQKLANAPEVQTCLATQMFRYLLGQKEAAGDGALLAAMAHAAALPENSYREVILELVSSDQFRYLAVGGP